MRREVEVKAKVDCDRLNYIVSNIKSLGGVIEEPVKEIDYYYTHPCRDFRVTDEALRVRITSRGEVKMTYKGPRLSAGDVKTRLEIESLASSSILDILNALGFSLATVVSKTRQYAKLGNIKVTLDRLEGMGCFIEVETSEGDPLEALSLIIKGVPYQIIHKTYLELVLDSRYSKTKPSP